MLNQLWANMLDFKNAFGKIGRMIFDEIWMNQKTCMEFLGYYCMADACEFIDKSHSASRLLKTGGS